MVKLVPAQHSSSLSAHPSFLYPSNISYQHVFQHTNKPFFIHSHCATFLSQFLSISPAPSPSHDGAMETFFFFFICSSPALISARLSRVLCVLVPPQCCSGEKKKKKNFVQTGGFSCISAEACWGSTAGAGAGQWGSPTSAVSWAYRFWRPVPR